MDLTQSGVQAPAAGGQQQGQGGQPAGAQPQQGVQTTNQPSAVQATVPVQQTGQQPAGQPQGGQPASTVMIPLDVVTAIRKELSESKEKIAQLTQQAQQFQVMSQMNGFGNQPAAQAQVPGQQQIQPQQSAQPQEQDPLHGLDDADLLTVKEMRGIIQRITARNNGPDINQALGPINQTLARVMVQLQDPQYETTIRTYLPEMILQNPMIRDMIGRAPNPLLAALGVAKLNPRYVQAQQAQQQGQPQAQNQPPDPLAELQRIIENATKPGAPGQVGGGAGAVSGHDRFRVMNDQDFDAEINRVLSGGAR